MHTGTVITLIDFLPDSLPEVDSFLWLFFFLQVFFVQWALPFHSSARLVSTVTGLGSTPQPGTVPQDITVPKAPWTLLPPLALLDTTAPLELFFLCPALSEQ